MTDPPGNAQLPVRAADVESAVARVLPHVRHTPTLLLADDGAGGGAGAGPAARRQSVVLKLEQLQLGGSFKIRGAINCLALAPDGALAHGVVTASGGNHGIGVALAARRFGAAATIFLPVTAPASSERLLASLGARTVRGGAAWDDAWALCRKEAGERGALAVHPFEDPAVIAGQGTVGLEFLDDQPDLDALVVAIGGGGLIAGVAVAARARRPDLCVVGVEPQGAASMHAALAAGRVVELDAVRTIAGTLAPRAVGENTLAMARALVDEIVLVSDDELRAAMRRLWSELRLLVEPAGAAALAALWSGRSRRLADRRRVGVLLCGANLDVDAVLG